MMNACNIFWIMHNVTTILFHRFKYNDNIDGRRPVVGFQWFYKCTFEPKSQTTQTLEHWILISNFLIHMKLIVGLLFWHKFGSNLSAGITLLCVWSRKTSLN